MGDPPSPVRIDDLVHPRFSPEVQTMVAEAAAFADQVELHEGALTEQAMAETGLDDFGDPGFMERLRILTAALRDEAALSPMGRLSAHAQLLQFLKNRLLVEEELRRHPEIHDLEVSRPIVICGLPRTGTTHLHNLISSDPALRFLPYWESLEPVLPEAERPAAGEADPRLARTEAALGIIDEAMPYFERMHEMTVGHAHEEIHLLAIDLSSMYFDTMAPMPSWREWYKATDQTPHYDYLKTVLKVLQHLRGGDRWVLKSPQHLEQFGPLARVFPDATFVVTHRDPVSVLTSMLTMLCYSGRMSHDPVPVGEIVRYWTAVLEDMFRACCEDRDLLAASQSLDVRFQDFMADDVATVEEVYRLADQPFTGDVRTAMDRFMREHPRGRHGQVVYEPEQLGLDPDRLRERFAFYSDHFGVRTEA